MVLISALFMLIGTVRMTSAFIEHLKAQEFATVLNVSSVLGFVPMVFAALYSATKAGIHAYLMGLRYLAFVQVKSQAAD